MSILARLSFFIALFFITSVQATTPCIPISTLPMTIREPGNYCLTKNLINNSNLNAITISAPSVVLDLQDFTITSSNKRSDNRTHGIFSYNSRDITIKNGSIKGFMYGIYLSDKLGSDANLSSISGGHVVDNVTVSDCFFRGIRIEGIYNTVKNSTIKNIGGTTVFNDAFSMGIETIGPSAVIENNIISEIYGTGTGESVGISFSNNSSGSSATGNHIENKQNSNESSLSRDKGNKFGIWVGGNPIIPTNAFIRNNQIRNMTYGVVFSSPTNGWYSNNQISQAKCDYRVCSLTVSTFNHTGLVCCSDDHTT